MKMFQGRAGGLKEDCYATLLAHAQGAASVLEFGPGGSTFAFIEAGVKRIVTCEHDAGWLDKARSRFAEHSAVSVHLYQNAPNVTVEGLSARAKFDLAFVDSPPGNRFRVEHEGQEGLSRFNTLAFAIRRAPVVLLHDAGRDGEQASLARLAAMGHGVEILAGRGNIARITRGAA
ncbi:hypothetical protein [Pelagibacterium limicola]|uniref:hypothetical protein n=1 Tax=Pelagibacterium limicola TaxID=2791022 RepID=UPI0018AF9B5A|nr:hypothetical protein [Pelagibacterium limicola]